VGKDIWPKHPFKGFGAVGDGFEREPAILAFLLEPLDFLDHLGSFDGGFLEFADQRLMGSGVHGRVLVVEKRAGR
jgi:hypothetical protein